MRNINRDYYDHYWRATRVCNPSIWGHWQLVKRYKDKICLEIGPGTRPKIPVKNNYFIDISKEAMRKLGDLGGKVYTNDLTNKFPFSSATFDLICAFEVLEHISDDHFVLKEISRTLKDKGIFLSSFPLNQHLWNAYDQTVGHKRRYQPEQIDNLFKENNLKIVKYAKLSTPWPGKVSGYFLSLLSNTTPHLLSKIQELIDLTTLSPLRQPIHLRQWNSYSYLELTKVTTGLFMAEKREAAYD